MLYTKYHMHGYSQTPLVQKLGIKEGMSIALLQVPDKYIELLNPLPEQINIFYKLTPNLDFIHFFAKSHQSLKEEFPNFKNALKKTGTLWISWPKATCSFASTDLTENTVRSIGLTNGMVDVKIAAIDDDWSALKFVYRIKDR